MENLDAQINIAGYEIAQIVDENLINKILGVLSSDGVYAMWVYCKSKKDIDENQLLEKLKDVLELKDDKEQYFQKLSENLHDLLFKKEILEKALTYARYHAKAMDDK
jgi:hypothetical protein